jgi:hypothetical protein
MRRDVEQDVLECRREFDTSGIPVDHRPGSIIGCHSFDGRTEPIYILTRELLTFLERQLRPHRDPGRPPRNPAEPGVLGAEDVCVEGERSGGGVPGSPQTREDPLVGPRHVVDETVQVVELLCHHHIFKEWTLGAQGSSSRQ